MTERWEGEFSSLSVAIIGGGVAGLVTAREFVREGAQVTLYEQRGQLGGVWAQGYRNFGLQSPKELYQLPCDQFDEQVPQYPKGEDVIRYLRNVARHGGVTARISKMNCKVTKLSKLEDRRGWQVEWRDPARGIGRAEHQLVVMCTGVYSTASSPVLPGTAGFQGQVIHSSQYHDPGATTTRAASNVSCGLAHGKTVVVVGGGKSAADVAMDASKTADRVVLVSRRFHWPIPLEIVCESKWWMLNRITSSCLPLYQRPSSSELRCHCCCGSCIWCWWRIVEVF